MGYATIKRILVQGLDQTTLTPAIRTGPEPPLQFARPWTDFFGETGGEHVQ
jgi:hypothetical protein